jgi:hypothetical protein
MTTATSPDLRSFVEAYRVIAEISPHYETSGGRRAQTGLDLTLLARPSSRCAADPGCLECQRVHALLRDLAHSILPGGWRDAAEPFDAAFHYRRETGWQPEIEVVVEMQPRAWSPPVEAIAQREMPEIRKRLREIGVGEPIAA